MSTKPEPVQTAPEQAATGTAVAASTGTNPNYVAFDEPIQRGEQTINGVTLRKPRSGELRGVQLAQLMQLDVASLQTVLPRITSPTLTAHDVANLDPADLLAVAGVMAGFFLTKAERASLPA